MVTKSSQRPLPQPNRPNDPARCLNERCHGIMRKIHALTQALSKFDVQIGLLIQTPKVEYTYESKENMLHEFDTKLPEDKRYRAEDVERLFLGRSLTCPSINSTSPLRGRSGYSSPTPSSSSAASVSSAPVPAMGLSFPTLPPAQPAGQVTTAPDTSPISVSALPATETEVTLPASPSPPQGESLLLADTGLSPTFMFDFRAPTSPAMDVSNLLNLESWPAAPDVPFLNSRRPLPSSRPIRTTTPPPSARARSRLQDQFRVLKFRAPPNTRGKWFDWKG